MIEDDIDRTARMLRRLPIDELEQKARQEGVNIEPHRSKETDIDFLYRHGYTLDEYIKDSFEIKARKAVRQINDALRKSLQKRLGK